MLSFNMTTNFLSLVLILIFTFGSSELRLAIGVLSSWALGHILQRRRGLSAGPLQAFHAYIVLSFGLLAATNDIFRALFAPRFLRAAAIVALCLLSLVLWSRLARDHDKSLDATIEYLGEHGELPPWYLAAREERERLARPVPKPKRDTRYCHLSDEVIFVCGYGGGFERVHDLDFEGAIARRRAIYPRGPDYGWSRRAEIKPERKPFAFA